MKREISVLGVLLVCATHSAAQEHGPDRVSFEARFGWAHPTRDLGRTGVIRNWYIAFDRVQASPMFGGGLDLHLSGPLHVRARADYVSEADASGQWFCDAFSVCPAVLLLVDGRVSRWSVGGDVVVRPRPSGWPFEPTVFVGAGRNFRSVQWGSVQGEPIAATYDRSGTFVRAGLGVARTVGRMSIFAEVEALSDSFGEERPLFIEGVVPPDVLGAPETLVDVGVSVGVRVRIR